MKNYEQALEINTRIGEQSVIQGLLSNIAHIWERKGDFSKALECLDRATIISKQIGDERVYTHILSSKSEVFIKTGEYDQSIALSQEGLEIARRLLYKAGICNALHNLGVARSWKGDRENAIENLSEALDKAKQWELNRSVAWVHLSFGELHMLNDDHEKARRDFEKGTRRVNSSR